MKQRTAISIKVSAEVKAELQRIADERSMTLTGVLLVAAAYQYKDSSLKDLLLKS